MAIAGGNATSNVTGTTYVEVGGNGTAIGVIGGGVAGSIDISGDGSSSSNAITSTASTGRTHVVINLVKHRKIVQLCKLLLAILKMD